MGIVALKCSFQIMAGIIPEQPIGTLTRTLHLTSKDLSDPAAFKEQQKKAFEYAMDIQDPNKVNWVRLEWVWY